MRSAMRIRSWEEDRICNSVSRYTVRREEEIGARLSDDLNMNSTKLVGNTGLYITAMHFVRR